MHSFSLSCIGEENGNPLQCSCLENPRDGGAWWAAIYGVAQSRTWLKRLSSSSRCIGLSLSFLFCSIDLYFGFFFFLFCQHHTVLNIVALLYSLKTGRWFLQFCFTFSRLLCYLDPLYLQSTIFLACKMSTIVC